MLRNLWTAPGPPIQLYSYHFAKFWYSAVVITKKLTLLEIEVVISTESESFVGGSVRLVVMCSLSKKPIDPFRLLIAEKLRVQISRCSTFMWSQSQLRFRPKLFMALHSGVDPHQYHLLSVSKFFLLRTEGQPSYSKSD